ncbi:MAG: hypothetical protein H6741_19295 [Alphaproteobacteria bacterium]|nr:hypothetical protein [Alphaproteobacteria bacterium]
MLTLPLALLLACNADKSDPDSPGGDSGVPQDDSGADDSASDDSAVDDTGSVPQGACPVTLRYTARAGAAQVSLAGPFNGWDPGATPLVDEGGGVFTLSFGLDPGAWPYKLVEHVNGEQRWACDPEAAYAQCDEGYTWAPECIPGGAGCNSMLVVSCEAPEAAVQALSIDREAGSLRFTPSFTSAPDGAPFAELVLEVDGVEEARLTELSEIEVAALQPGRHTVRATLRDAAGRSAEPLYIPAWTDDRAWETGLMYWVFVDRFSNGDPSRDGAEGTSDAITDYLGGDWQGVIDKLDYLDEMGITALWITAPQDNAEGAWGDKCGADFSGYHGYWPSDPWGVEEHFGSEDDFRRLVAEAHARGMRVLVDWVANHVHQDHPYALEHPEWFNELLICEGDVWNTAPEVCWFDPFLPDIRYYDPAPLVQMVDDAVAWIQEYELDGYRVDAVKHVPHSLLFNLQSRIRAEVEHRVAGGDEAFYTVGETYSGDRALIASYVDARQLDAQFDFPLYWAILATFARDEMSLRELEQALADSEAAYGGALMSTFLGNHDVERFIAHASGEVVSLYGDGPCGGDGALRRPDTPPDADAPYQRLKLAWTWLLAHEGLPLVYYGDEIGLEGYADPDNRHLMRFGDALSAREADVLAHVQALGQARRAHPAMSTGARAEWWIEDDVSGWARVSGGDEVLAVVNRSGQDRALTNGLSFAGLTPGATFRDALSGQVVVATGDQITVDVPAMGSVVLIKE